MGRDVYTLLCPDWRGPSLVLEGASGRVAHANWRCLRLLAETGPARISGGKLIFTPADLNRRFYGRLEQAQAAGVERAVVVAREDGKGLWFSAAIHLPLGFARDTLQRALGPQGGEIAVVDFAASGSAPDRAAFAALAEAAGLAPAESQLVLSLLQGLSAEEIAEARGSSLSTVRQRIKAVLAKTHCTRQSELVGLVRGICPAGSDG